MQAQLSQKKSSYKECYDSSCRIELGKAVAAEAIVTTKILKVGGQCASTASLFDLKTELSIKGATAESGSAEKDLLGAIESVASQL